MHKKKQKHKKFGWPEWALLGIVAVSAVMIGVALCAHLIDTPEEVAEKELAALADDYYIEYLYPRILGNVNRDPAEAFQDYIDVGIPTAYLRQMLHYDDQHQSAEKALAEIKCDTNTTGARFYPQAPYGPHDYEVTYIWGCEEKSQD